MGKSRKTTLKSIYQCIIDTILDDLDKHNGYIMFYNSKYAYQGNTKNGAGYFIIKNNCPSIHIGSNRHVLENICTLLHEYCHFKQWKMQTRIWKKEKNPQSIFLIEKECEEMTVRLIKKLKLTNYICIDHYIQQANAYVTFCYLKNIITCGNVITPYTKFIYEHMPHDRIIDPRKYSFSKKLISEYLKCM